MIHDEQYYVIVACRGDHEFTKFFDRKIDAIRYVETKQVPRLRQFYGARLYKPDGTAIKAWNKADVYDGWEYGTEEYKARRAAEQREFKSLLRRLYAPKKWKKRSKGRGN